MVRLNSSSTEPHTHLHTRHTGGINIHLRAVFDDCVEAVRVLPRAEEVGNTSLFPSAGPRHVTIHGSGMCAEFVGVFNPQPQHTLTPNT